MGFFFFFRLNDIFAIVRHPSHIRAVTLIIAGATERTALGSRRLQVEITVSHRCEIAAAACHRGRMERLESFHHLAAVECTRTWSPFFLRIVAFESYELKY